jgi:hypothetical protein
MESPEPQSRGYLVRRTALIGGAVALVAILSAHFLSRMAQKGEFPTIAFIRSSDDIKHLAERAPSAQPREPTTYYRAIGIDGVVTATIPGRSKRLGAGRE